MINALSQNFFQKINLPISNYSNYSNPKHLKVDGSDDAMANNILEFTLITAPQVVIITLVFWGVFKLLFNFQVSILFRRYSLFFGSVLQALLEGNVGYFTYLAFNQINIMFTFFWKDRIFIGYSTCIFFFIIIFSLCFFFLIALQY